MFIINSILLIIILLINILISAELVSNIEAYVTVFNEIHNSVKK